MALSSGTAEYVYDTQVTVSTAAGTLADGAVDAESKTAVTNTAPLADAALTVAYSVSPTLNSAIHLYRRELNVDGTTDTNVPTTSGFKGTYVGSFIVAAQTASQTCFISSIPLSGDDEFYIENDTGQTISSGWVLKVKPKSYNAVA